MGEKTGCGGRNVQKHSKVLPNVAKCVTRRGKRWSGDSKKWSENIQKKREGGEKGARWGIEDTTSLVSGYELQVAGCGVRVSGKIAFSG